eukprot:1021894-Alexandrium_andersonii.AAC.1
MCIRDSKSRGVGGAGAVAWSIERGAWRKIGTASRRVDNCTGAPQAELAAVGLVVELLASPVAGRTAAIAGDCPNTVAYLAGA